MQPNPFTPDFFALPDTLPIFPLPGVILLPKAQLPLNIFEPRYLNMTFDALGGNRMIGMIQPRPAKQSQSDVPVYKTGCAGRITSFQETDDGRLLVALTGVIRFDVVEELPTVRGYRRVVAGWKRFASDLDDQDVSSIEAAALVESLEPYFSRYNINVDRDTLRKAPSWLLVNGLAMSLPFDAEEKQALVEAMTTDERAQLLTGMSEMALSAQESPSDVRH